MQGTENDRVSFNARRRISTQTAIHHLRQTSSVPLSLHQRPTSGTEFLDQRFESFAGTDVVIARFFRSVSPSRPRIRLQLPTLGRTHANNEAFIARPGGLFVADCLEKTRGAFSCPLRFGPACHAADAQESASHPKLEKTCFKVVAGILFQPVEKTGGAPPGPGFGV